MEKCDCLINQSETGYYSHITCTDLTAHDPSQVQYCGEESHHAYATALSTAPPQASADCSVGGLHSTGF